MALLFNQQYLDSISTSSMSYIDTLRYYRAKTLVVPPPGVSRRLNRSRMVGQSFLLNPDELLNDRRTDPSYIVQYIKLAARRDYAMYKLYNITYLDLSYYPDIDRSKISHNPLLSIAGEKLFFKYEENSNGNRIQ